MNETGVDAVHRRFNAKSEVSDKQENGNAIRGAKKEGAKPVTKRRTASNTSSQTGLIADAEEEPKLERCQCCKIL